MQTSSIFVLLIMLGAGQGQNLLDNPSFEDDLKGTWDNNGFFMERVAGDTVDGNFALKASYRDRDVEGPLQTLYGLKPNGRYEMSAYVKLLNDISGTLWQKIRINMQFQFADTGEIGTYAIAYRGLCDSSMGWIRVNGSLNAPVRAFNWVRFAIRGPEAGVNILVDKAALYEVPENINWLADSHTNIDKYRKSSVSISFTPPVGVPASVFDVQVRLKKHLFPFGANVKDTQISKKSTDEYSKLVFNMFNWVVVPSYKWKFDKGDRYNPDFSNAATATNLLVANGVKVRGHNILWDVYDNIPDWVLALSGQELKDELDKHAQYICNLALGKLVQWDVMNEHTHGLYYEQKLLDRNFTKNLFRQIRRCDNATTLYFNDYQGVDIGGSTEEYYQLMTEYLAEGVPVGGLGAQGHIQSFTAPDPTLIWRRLDRLGMLGIEVFMTEFDVEWPDIIQRADWIEDAMRVFFTHPALKGVIYWTLWDLDSQNVNKELVKGTNVTIIEPGQRYFCLLKKEWTTNTTRNLGNSLNVALRGFQGDYEGIVRRSGVPIQVERFSLGASDLSINIKVTNKTGDSKELTEALSVEGLYLSRKRTDIVQERVFHGIQYWANVGKETWDNIVQLAAVSVVEDKDYVPACVSHRGQKSLGLQSTVSTNMQLACVNVQSEPSGPTEDDVTSVTCGTDRVMTGCTSFQNDLLWTRKGEQIVIEDGVAVCKAYNGRNSTGGVTADARCCKVSGLTCDYRVAGPSMTFDGALAEAVCPANTQPLGCSTYSRYPDMDGSYVDVTVNSCVAQTGSPAFSNPGERSGSIAFAACCSSPDLTCTRVTSGETGLSAGDSQGVVCPSDYVMMSCSYFAQDGRSGGARIVDSNGKEECRVYIGDNLPAGSRGVVAAATCCQ